MRPSLWRITQRQGVDCVVVGGAGSGERGRWTGRSAPTPLDGEQGVLYADTSLLPYHGYCNIKPTIITSVYLQPKFRLSYGP
jgi:hypothetical protein